MAVNNTGTLFKSFTFDGANSRDYGVYITGAGVYNAPQREVEMISIPNRNGSFALDKGRFENIEVTYPAGIYADSETDFADAISEFRNLLCSKNGYCRLTDEYNPNEYRMAIYKSGLEVEPAQLKAGEFEIVFECMPQRFLTSGETEITVSNNQTITNPTRFDAKPLIKAAGSGSIGFNGHTIVLTNATIGYLLLADSAYAKATAYYTELKLPIDTGKVNSGNTITASNVTAKVAYSLDSVPSSISYTKSSGTPELAQTVTHRVSGTTMEFTLAIPSMTFRKGTTSHREFAYDLTFTTDGVVHSGDLLQIDVDYDGADEITTNFYNLNYAASTIIDCSSYFKKIDATSTQTSLGNPTYIDCEEGEAYKYVNGEYVEINPYVSFGSELPTLAAGANTITKTSSITSLKIIPRWWRV